MKYFLSILMLALFCSMATWSANGTSFTASTTDGVEITFMVISEDEKTCQVGNGSSTCMATGFTGTITIPSFANGYKVVSIGKSAFQNCFKLESIVFPDYLASIGMNAFYQCQKLSSLTIPQTVTFIDEGAFNLCNSITSVSVDSNNSVYDSRNNCNAIIETATNTLIAGFKNSVIPNGITCIGKRAFKDCSRSSINIPNSVTKICENAFCQSGLTSVTIPASVTLLDGEYVFENCHYLASIVVDSQNPVYDSRNNCNAIIETNSNTLLYGCKNSIIPDGVKHIANHAFFQTYLTEINLPNSIESIGRDAFYGCI